MVVYSETCIDTLSVVKRLSLSRRLLWRPRPTVNGISGCGLSQTTVNCPNNGHFGTWASVLYSGSVLCWGVLDKHLPQGLNNACDSTITHFNWSSMEHIPRAQPRSCLYVLSLCLQLPVAISTCTEDTRSILQEKKSSAVRLSNLEIDSSRDNHTLLN